MRYFLITHSEDGDTYMRQINPADFLKEITEENEGQELGMPILSGLPKDYNLNDCGAFRLIIRGEIITPTPTVIVKAYAFPSEY